MTEAYAAGGRVVPKALDVGVNASAHLACITPNETNTGNRRDRP